MIALSTLRAEAKRVLGPRALVDVGRGHAQAYRVFFSRKHANPITISIAGVSQQAARAALLAALRGMPAFEGEPDMELWR